MTNFTERAVPTITANFLMQEAVARYIFAKKYISLHKTVVDLACGTGYGSRILLEKSQTYIGIDINEEALTYAQKKYSGPNSSFLKMDVNNLIFKNYSFESAVAFEMIEHLDSAQIFLKEVSRILTPKGVFVVSTPNRLVQSPNGKLMSPYHTKEYDPQEFERLLKKHFSHVTIFGQRKSKKAIQSVDAFMFSQKVRQTLVDLDFLRFRKLFSPDTKEIIWKYLGNLVGRKAQENITNSDYLITKKNLDSSEYLLAVCKK